MFLIGHEIAHITLGHVDYIASKTGSGFVPELGWDLPTEEGKLERQAMEVQADYRSVVSAIKRLDPQVLLDPLEEKLHSPALFVNVGNRFCRDVKVVCEKHQMLLSFFVNITDSAQPLRIRLLGFLRC
jgi:hypothetical protein